MSRSTRPEVKSQSENKFDKLLFPSNKRLVYVLDIVKRTNFDDIKQILSHIGAIAVKKVDKRLLPIAIISDAQYASFMETATEYQKGEKYKNLPEIFKDAITLDIPIVTIKTFIDSYSIARRLRSFHKHEAQAAAKRKVSSVKNNVTRVTSTHVLIRDRNTKYGPLFKQIKLPIMHLGQGFGASLFHAAPPDLEMKRKKSIDREKEFGIEYENVTTSPFVEYVDTGKRTINKGYCEICKENFPDMWMHFSTDEHIKRVNEPNFYSELDNVIDEFSSSFIELSDGLCYDKSDGFISLPSSESSVKDFSGNEDSLLVTSEVCPPSESYRHNRYCFTDLPGSILRNR